MLNYTGTIAFSGSIVGTGGVSGRISGDFGVVLSASLPNGTTGTATQVFNGSVYYELAISTNGFREAGTLPFSYTEPDMSFHLGDNSYSTSIPITNYGFPINISVNADINATSTEIDETFTLGVTANDFGIALQGEVTGSGTLIAQPNPLEVVGGSAQVTTDLASVSPFQGVTIVDPNDAQTDMVTVTLSDAANGTLTNLAGGTYDAATGVYTVTGSAASVSAALQDLVFIPTAHQVLPGQTVTTSFTISATDTLGSTVTSTPASITASAIRTGFQNDRFNGGSTSDVLFRNANSGLVLDWKVANGQVEAGQPIAGATPDWSLVGTGDFTGVGSDDILFQNNQSGLVLDWLVQNGTLTGSQVIGGASAGWTVIGTGDLYGNGTDDILFQNQNSGLVLDWQMQNNAVVAGNVIAGANFDWQFVGAGDFHGTGTDDLLFQNRNSGAVLDWQMQNGNVVGGQVIGNPSYGWSVIGIGDFTGSGIDDILLRNSASGTLADWQMANGAIASNINLGAPGPGSAVVGVGDYTGNGMSQVLVQDASGAVSYWPVASAGTPQIPLGYASADWKLA